MSTNQIKENIFDFKKWDGSLYFLLYIAVPVLVTWFSLKEFPDDNISATYCYVTILISALNCIYDATTRWISGEKTFRNIKLGLVLMCVAIIVLYCIYVILGALITRSIERCDWVLWIYSIVVIVATGDFVKCFTADMAMKAATDTVLKE